MLRYGDGNFQPADPKARGKWSDGDSNNEGGDSGYDIKNNGERTAAAEHYRDDDEDVRYVEDARQLAPATAPPRSETSRSSRNSSKNSKKGSRNRDSLRMDREEDEGFPSPPSAKSPLSNGIPSSPSEDNTDDKYDEAYYTNEPLPNKPAPKAFNRHE